MDLSTLLGFIIGFAGLIVGFALEEGNLASLILLSPAVIVIGGTIGAVMVSHKMSDIQKIPRLFKEAFIVQKVKTEDTIDMIVKLAGIARKEGLLSLEETLTEGELATKVDPMMKKGIMLAVDGNSSEVILDIMQTEVYLMESDRKGEIAIFEAAGGFSPTMGIIGTVMGLVTVLGNLADPEELARSIAAAFIATLYGVVLANLVYLPIASKLKFKLKDEKLEKQLIIEGVVSLNAGESPLIIKEKLQCFLPKVTKKTKPTKNDEKQDVAAE